jgi:hypothetical protein
MGKNGELVCFKCIDSHRPVEKNYNFSKHVIYTK